MIIRFADLTVPFPGQFLQRKSQHTVRFVQRQLIHVYPVFHAVQIKFVPLIKEFFRFRAVLCKNKSAIEIQVLERQCKIQFFDSCVNQLMLFMIPVIFPGMQVSDGTHVAPFAERRIQGIGNHRISVNIQEIAFNQIAHIRFQKTGADFVRNLLCEFHGFIFIDHVPYLAAEIRQISVGSIIHK